MIRPLLFALITVVHTTSFAQDGSSPENRRYLNQVFDTVKFTGDIPFSTKVNDHGNREETLKLRVFEPADDSERRRPLLLMTPGGGFVASDDTWMNEFAEQIAKAGYVVALNSYRLSADINTPVNYFTALAKAVEDQRDAIAYFIKDAKNANRFGIDPNKVFISGHSAGAITSMHTAYVDSDDPIQPLMHDIFQKRGLLPEREKQPKLKGVINLSGLLSNLAIIDRNDTPLLSLHGDADSIVKITSDEHTFGSIPIHQYADIVGTENELHVIKGALHIDTSASSLCEECIPLIKRFMFDQLQGDK